jgi:hypothetical protein
MHDVHRMCTSDQQSQLKIHETLVQRCRLLSDAGVVGSQLSPKLRHWPLHVIDELQCQLASHAGHVLGSWYLTRPIIRDLASAVASNSSNTLRLQAYHQAAQ